jgi:hypothetical protein
MNSTLRKHHLPKSTPMRMHHNGLLISYHDAAPRCTRCISTRNGGCAKVAPKPRATRRGAGPQPKNQKRASHPRRIRMACPVHSPTPNTTHSAIQVHACSFRSTTLTRSITHNTHGPCKSWSSNMPIYMKMVHGREPRSHTMMGILGFAQAPHAFCVPRRG